MYFALTELNIAVFLASFAKHYEGPLCFKGQALSFCL